MHRFTNFSLCIIFLFLSSHSSSAQDQPLKERFLWLPTGNYTSLDYIDPPALKAGKGWQVYSETLGAFGIRSLVTAPIPQDDLDNLQYWIRADLFNGKVTPLTFKEGEDPMKMQPPPGDIIGGKVVGNRNYFVHGTRDRLQIYGFLDGQLAVQRGIRAGYLEADGNEILGGPTYTLKPQKNQFRREYEPLKAWLTPTGELLVAEKIELLKQMARAGLGEIPSMSEDQLYIEVFESADGFGQEWNILNESVMKRMLFEALVEHGEDRAEIDKAEHWMDEGYDWIISTIDVTIGLSSAEKMFFPTENSALAFAQAEQAKTLGDGESITRDGNIIIERQVFTDEIIEQWKQRVEKWRKQLEERRKKDAESEGKL